MVAVTDTAAQVQAHDWQRVDKPALVSAMLGETVHDIGGATWKCRRCNAQAASWRAYERRNGKVCGSDGT